MIGAPGSLSSRWLAGPKITRSEVDLGNDCMMVITNSIQVYSKDVNIAPGVFYAALTGPVPPIPPIPPDPPVPPVGTAATPATLAAVVAALTAGGGNILLAPGDYGALSYTNLHPGGAGLVFFGTTGVHCSTFNTTNCSKLTLQYVAITGQNSSGYAHTASSGCDTITVDHCVIDSGVVLGSGLQARSSSNITWTNNTIRKKFTAFGALDVTGLTIEHNSVNETVVDGFLGTGIVGCSFQYNYIGPFTNPSQGHPDFCQFSSSATRRSSNIVIQYNNFDRAPTGGLAQGDFIERTDNLTIKFNCIFGGMVNGVSISDSTQVDAQHNFVQSWDAGSKFIVRGGSDHVNFSNNSAVRFEDYAGSGVNTNVTITGNTIILNATSPTDTTARDLFLAANPLIPLS